MSPDPMPLARVVRAYLAEARYESLRCLRAPAFALPFLLIPIALYALFGSMAAGAVAKKPETAVYLFTGFSVIGVMGPAVFGFGMFLAQERDQRLLALKRALPMPPGAHLFGKASMALVFSGLIMATLVAAAKGLSMLALTPLQFASVVAVLVIGSLPFCAIGLFIGASASARTAPAFVNLAYQPMVYLSSLFFQLPKSIEAVTLASPAFHLNQLALGVAGIPSVLGPAMHIAVLLGVTVLFGGLALRRLAREG